MPTYHARGVSAHLGAMPLANTITHDIVLRKGERAKEQCETAEKKLLSSELLAEEPVYFPSDEAGFELNWLGNAPFMQVQAGRDYFRQEDEKDAVGGGSGSVPQTAYGRRRARLFTDNAHEDDDKPRALALHIKLSGKTFTSGLNRVKTNLKIDVFFNGQLSGCLFVPVHDVRSGVKPLHQVFAGTRVDYLAERPWVILPPGMMADGNGRKTNKASSVEQRWQQICQALQEEASERGIDTNGNVPPSAEFLRALAIMQMPEQVTGMQKAGGRHLGVIDVVISAGDGKKVTSGIGYLKAPQRLTDENFPLILGGDGTEVQSHVAGTRQSGSEGEADNLIEPSPELIDVDAEGESDSEYEPQPKRRALAPQVLSMQPTYNVLSSSTSGNPFVGIQIPSIPPPVRKISKSSPSPVANKNPSKTSSPFASPGRHTYLSSSPERGRTHEELEDGSEETHWNNRFTHSGAPQGLYSQPNSNAAFSRTPQMRPSPYSFQFSDSMSGHDLPHGLKSLSSSTNGLTSSPLQRFPTNPNDSNNDPIGSSTRAAETFPAMFGSNPFAAPMPLAGQARWGSSGFVHSPPSVHTASSNYTLSGIGPQAPGAPMFPMDLPGMLPHMPTPFGLHGPMPFASYPFLPPYNRRPSAPLPPTGLYTVPTKPKLSASPERDRNLVNLDKYGPSILVTRLVVTGQNGIILLDHRWSSAQRITVNIGSSSERTSHSKLPMKSTEETSGSAKYVDVPMEPRRSRRNTVKMNTPPPTSPSKDVNSIPSIILDDKNRFATNRTQVIHEPFKFSSTDPTLTAEASRHGLADKHDTIEEYSELPTRCPTTASLAAKRPAPQRRTASGNSILGVQGPKANPFWLEDPEEILREAARLRRIRSPAKRRNTAAIALQPKPISPTADSLDVSQTVASSPLSSPPTTPEREVEPTMYIGPTQATDQSPRKTKEPVAQMDGSPERKIDTAPHRSFQTPSPTKLVAAANPRLQPQGQPMSKSSPSPNTKKRKAKALSRYLPKQPRSPDRLKTVSNPSLNRDCVIAYAESENKHSKKGVLRQVRGERQGVFQEEYVVFAARFFIPGD